MKKTVFSKFNLPLVIALLIFFSTLIVHLPFVLFHHFGEQDAARIANMALYGHLSEKGLRLYRQWPFSTPLYIHVLYLALEAKIIAGHQLISVMAAASLLASSLFSALFYVFMYNATRVFLAPLAMTVLLQFAPPFWLNSLYGFPTMVALTLFMASALIFQFSVYPDKRLNIVGLVASSVILCTAVLFKVDVVMAAALFCLPVWQSRRHLTQKIAITIGLILMSCFAFWLLNQYGLSLSKYKTASSNWQDWSNSFYKGFSPIFSQQNREIIIRSIGVASLPFAFVAACLAFYHHAGRNIVIWMFFAITPIALFWSSISGNSARHNLIPAIFITVIMAVPLVFLKKGAFFSWILCLITACVFNYFWWPPVASTAKPSGRLIESAELLKTKFGSYTEQAKAVTKMPHSKIMVTAPDHLLPIFVFAPMANPDFTYVEKGGEKVYVKENGGYRTFFFPTAGKGRNARIKARKEGYFEVRVK